MKRIIVFLITKLLKMRNI